MIDETLKLEMATEVLKKLLPAEMIDEALAEVNSELKKNSAPTKISAEEKISAPTKIFSASDRASVLVEALPYILEFHGKTIVIKYGGNAWSTTS